MLIGVKSSDDVLSGNYKTKNLEVVISLIAAEPDILLCKVPVVCVKLLSCQEMLHWSTVLHNACAIFSSTDGEQNKVSKLNYLKWLKETTL